MKIKNALSMIAAVLAIASAGETKAGPEAGPETGRGLGTIIVYRPWSIIGRTIKNWEFNLDGGPDLFVRNGTYYRLTVLQVITPSATKICWSSMMTHRWST